MEFSTNSLGSNVSLAALQAVAVPLMVLDAQSRVVFLNEASETLFGFTAGELQSTVFWEAMVSPEDRDRARQVCTQGDPRQRPTTYSLDLLTKAGERVRVSCSHQWLSGTDGRPSYTVITALEQAIGHAVGTGDSVESKEAENAQGEAHRSYQTLISNFPGLAYRCKRDRSWITVYSSEGCAALTGYSSDDLVRDRNVTWMGLVHPDDLQSITDKIDAAIREHRPFQLVYRIITASGDQKWVWDQGRAVYDASGALSVLEGFITDVTEQKRAERALSESEGRFRRLANRAPALIRMSDTCKRCTWFNDTWLSYTGRSMEQELGDGWSEGVHADDLQHCLDVYTSAFDARKDFQLEYRLRRHDGSYGWIVDVGIPRLADDNSFEGYIGYCWDVTDRKRTADALQVSEQRFHAIFNSTFQFIGLLSPDGIVLEANQAALDFAGLGEQDVVGRPFWETEWWALSPEIQDHLKASIQESARGKLVRYEVEHIGAGGRIAVVDFSLKPVLNERGEAVLIIPEGRDITERKLAEEREERHKRELAHVMRLNTMGEMASGLAHELNQPLMAIASYCETALAELAKRQTAAPWLNDILQRALGQSHRAADVIRHLREFVSDGSTAKQLVDIDQLIRELIELLDWEFRNSKVKITLELRGQGHKVMADKVQIEQVLINLLLNSLEAMQNGNTGEGQLVLQSRVLSDNSIEVTVSDNGPGIDPELVERIFDPFQTSKKGGMGMGLSISRSIIEAHNGKLWLAEAPLGGALLAFSLPSGIV